MRKVIFSLFLWFIELLTWLVDWSLGGSPVVFSDYTILSQTFFLNSNLKVSSRIEAYFQTLTWIL